ARRDQRRAAVRPRDPGGPCRAGVQPTDGLHAAGPGRSAAGQSRRPKPEPSVTARGAAGVRDVPDRLTWRIEPDSRRPIRNANTGVEDRAQVNMWPLERLLPVSRLSV